VSAVKKLRAVDPSERAVKPLNVKDAAESGDHRALLVAMRSRIARAVSDPDCPPRDLAALTRRLQDISKEVEMIDLRLREEGADADALEGDEEFDPSAL
jgi:hypothetical protein